MQTCLFHLIYDVLQYILFNERKYSVIESRWLSALSSYRELTLAVHKCGGSRNKSVYLVLDMKAEI